MPVVVAPPADYVPVPSVEVQRTTPQSPSNSNIVVIEGRARSATVVTVYLDKQCERVAGQSTTSSAEEFAFAIEVSVQDNSRTTFYAVATDADGNRSSCDGSFITYVEDSIAPVVDLTESSPASPADHGLPIFRGTAEAGALEGVSRNSGPSLGFSSRYEGIERRFGRRSRIP